MINQELLVELFEKTIEISNKTKADCFFSYNPHVQTIDIDIYENGYAYNDPCGHRYVSEDGSLHSLYRAIDIENDQALLAAIARLKAIEGSVHYQQRS